MLFKKVKEYSKRQRIDINKSDGLTPGEDVAIIPKQKYDEIKQDILDLQNELMTARNESEMLQEINNNLEKQIQDLKDKEVNLQQLIKDAVTPIDEHYQKELENKSNEINQLQMELKTLRAKAYQNNLELMGLNIFDLGIFRKHKKLIKEFNQELTILSSDPNIVATDVKAIDNKNQK